ncbi:MAG: hypothetical protein PHT88_04200 [Candidatus Moranbacteria bacterium]|nr:hypothetical protein [Candidatus Moranbacteria bacterium]
MQQTGSQHRRMKMLSIAAAVLALVTVVMVIWAVRVKRSDSVLVGDDSAQEERKVQQTIQDQSEALDAIRTQVEQKSQTQQLKQGLPPKTVEEQDKKLDEMRAAAEKGKQSVSTDSVEEQSKTLDAFRAEGDR